MKTTMTEKRANWITEHIYEFREVDLSTLKCEGPRGGHNAATIPGWSHEYGALWARAIAKVLKGCPTMRYWGGGNPTSSTAIPRAYAKIIDSAPAEIR